MKNRFIRTLAVVVALGIAAIATTQNAYAGKGTRNFVLGTIAGVAGLAVLDSLAYGHRYNRGYRTYDAGYRYRRHRRHNYYNNYSPRRHYRSYYRSNYPKYRRYSAPRRVHRGRHAMWSPSWYRYCANRYRSFRRSDGTFQPYKGGRRLCR